MNPVKASPISGTLPLASLQLDSSNPRFGDPTDAKMEQRNVLDKIVETFGVDDVLSSLAVNGYFNAEPMVVRDEGNDVYTVVEGNRRLAACLMLIGDERAVTHRKRAKDFQDTWAAHGRPPIDPVPVIIFPHDGNPKDLLSYLGVRHISSAKSWDSYAKAAWVARVIENSALKVADVAAMIGDQHRTIERLLQGYYAVQQLIASGNFRPEDSVRRGRGSITQYPFSWVYTVLGYRAAQDYLGLKTTLAAAEVKDPIPKENLAKGGVLLRAMFGDSSAGRNAAVTDSRQLGDLASVVADQQKLALLEQGKSVEEITKLSQPTEDQLRQGLGEIRETLRALVARLEEDPPPAKVAESFLVPIGTVVKLATSVEQKLKAAVG